MSSYCWWHQTALCAWGLNGIDEDVYIIINVLINFHQSNIIINIIKITSKQYKKNNNETNFQWIIIMISCIIWCMIENGLIRAKMLLVLDKNESIH